MVNFYIYAKDHSGSTENFEYFHTNGLKTVEEFKSDVKRIKKESGESQTGSKIIYLHWGDRCYEVNEDTTVRTYIERKSGKMWTEPDSIILWIKQNYNICVKGNKIKLLYIITDGCIDSGKERCLKLNKKIRYETVVFHAFNEDLYQIDLSVAASFFKSRCLVYRNYELLDNVDISQDYDYDKITIDNFEAEKKNLESYIKLKFINTFKHNNLALQDIDELKKLRYRLFDELSSKLEKSDRNLETKDKNVFLREFVHTNWYKSINAGDHGEKVDIEKFISKLINYIVSDTKSYSFDVLKFETKFATFVEEEPIVNVEFAGEQEVKFPDIIMYEDEGIPVVLLSECNLPNKMIFHKTTESDPVSPASFNKFKSAMECPLFLINDLDISNSIGYFYTLNVYNQLLKKGTKMDPNTRRPFHGGLVLTDTDLFNRYNDYVLSATYFGSKKVKFNVGLFYYVLWKSCENKQWMDKNVLGQFNKYMLQRISATVCKIGLSSLPLDCQENVSLPTALWYCVELSSSIFKDDPLHFIHERLRMFYGVAHLMREILNYLNYDIDHDFSVKRLDLIKNVMILKKIPRLKDKVYYLLESIFRRVDGLFVCEIENPSNLYKLNYLKFNHKGILREEVMEEKVNLNDYVYLMHHASDVSKSNASRPTFRICQKTLRPFFTIDKNKSFYTELLKIIRKVAINTEDKDRIEITYEPLDALDFRRILSLYDLFINCVIVSKKYPSLPEYIEYISKIKKFSGDLVIIFPPSTSNDAEDVYLSYQNIMTQVDVSEFIKVSKKYFKRSERIKAEEVLKFNDDHEIAEFLAGEELKVNIKKKNTIK